VKEELEDERGGDLVGHVGHAHVKEGQLGFDDVTDQHLQLRLVVGALDTLLQFCHHSWIKFTGDHLLDFVQHLDGHVTRARTNLEYCVGVAQRRLVNNGLDDKRVLEDVLSEGVVELDVLSVLGFTLLLPTSTFSLDLSLDHPRL